MVRIFTDTRHWSMLADKYAVREYVQSRVGSDVLIPLLGQWKDADEINFNSFPQSFVIKPNNGSYDAIIVPDKTKSM